MLRALSTLVSVLLVVGLIGCGGSGESGQTPPASDGVTTADAGQDASTDPSGPAAAVTEFLDSFRAGDDAKTERMLTQKAREQAAAMDLVVAPPGTDTAKYKLGRVAYLPGDRAAVSCAWSDLAPSTEGAPKARMEMKTVEYVWMLRQEPEGWRIAGVAVPVLEGEPPLQLDFEDLKQMQSKLRWAHEQRTQRANQANSQAQRPENSENSARR